jgi:hypothetical protein
MRLIPVAGVSIPCRSVTPAMSPKSKSGNSQSEYMEFKLQGTCIINLYWSMEICKTWVN